MLMNTSILMTNLIKKAIEQALVNRAYDIINLKGYTNTGIAMVAARFTKSFMYNEHTIFTYVCCIRRRIWLK